MSHRQRNKSESMEYYRFSLRLPSECEQYLKAMAWMNRTTITEYLERIIVFDMKLHEEWRAASSSMMKAFDKEYAKHEVYRHFPRE